MIKALLLLSLVSLCLSATTLQFKVVSGTTVTPPQPNPYGVVFAIGSNTTSTELTLIVGETYLFNGSAIGSSHALYISTSADGAGAGIVTDNGVSSNNNVGVNKDSTNPVITWTPTTPTITPYYYQCNVRDHERMGWRINVVSPGGAVPTSSSSSINTNVVPSSRPNSGNSFVPSLLLAFAGVIALFA